MIRKTPAARRIVLLAATITLATTALTNALAQQAPKPEQIIRWRQSAFQTVAWNTSRIKAALDGTYNKDDVVKASAAIAAIANSGLPSLFPASTERGKGWHDTTARTEAFQDTKRFNERMATFGKEANELARIAGAGDAAAVKEQFGKLTRACKSCHDDFRATD
jgi:cytochrome c556